MYSDLANDCNQYFCSSLSGVTVTVVYEMHLTMIDGKVLSVITNTASTLRCWICKATSKQFNNLTDIKRRFKPEPGTLMHGMSVLHLWIRAFEHLLHLSYRRDFCEWQLRGTDRKAKALQRKLELQTAFLEKMNIRVAFPSTKGTGNSNNGNVCRVAFSDPDKLADILQLKEKNFVKRMRVILIALSCQLPLDEELFQEFCMQTAELYVEHYSWFPMPPSIHKVLIHSRDILLASELPVGVLAEDAAESCNKFYRHNRQFHARKDTRSHNLMDVYNRALDWSDPIVASHGMKNRQKFRTRKNLPPEVISLLMSHEAPTIQEPEEIDLDSSKTDFLEEFSQELNDLNLPEDPFYENMENNESMGDEEDMEVDEVMETNGT